MTRKSSAHNRFLDEANQRLLSWVRKTLGDTDITAARFDKLVPRKDHYQLRICVEDSCAVRRDETFVLMDSQKAPSGSLAVGNWAIQRPVPAEDPDLALERALSPSGFAEIRSVLPHVNAGRLVSYTPKRRAMLVYSSNDNQKYYGKFYRPEESGEVFERTLAARQGSLARLLAEPVAHIESLALVLWRGIEGDLLSDLYPSPAYADGLRLAGDVLRRLHDEPTGGSRQHASRTLADELLTIRKFVLRLEPIRRHNG